MSRRAEPRNDPEEMVRAVAINYPDRSSIKWNWLWFNDQEVEASFQVPVECQCVADTLINEDVHWASLQPSVPGASYIAATQRVAVSTYYFWRRDCIRGSGTY